MSKRRFNYYGKLLLFSMLMSSIPVIILGVFSFIRSAEAVEDHVQASNQQLLRQTQMNVERVLKIIDHNATQFMQTQLVGDSLQSRIPAEEFRFIADLQSQLIKMQTFELGIRDVILVNLKQNWSLSKCQKPTGKVSLR